jgi:methionyl-tRNA synthetase
MVLAKAAPLVKVEDNALTIPSLKLLNIIPNLTNIEPPKKVFAHGWWTINSEKMGKSAGNALKIEQLIGFAGVDSARYFLFREAPFGEDGDFSDKSLIDKHNNELANKLGNLVSRNC